MLPKGTTFGVVFSLVFSVTAVVLSLLAYLEVRTINQTPTFSDLERIESTQRTTYQTLKTEYEKNAQQLLGEVNLVKQNLTAYYEELTRLKDLQQSTYDGLVSQISGLDAGTRPEIEGLTARLKALESFHAEQYEDITTNLKRVKDELTVYADKIKELTARPVTPPRAATETAFPDGAYTIRITAADITSTDWVDNDPGQETAPPDCFLVIYQNDQEVYKSKVRYDTRQPVWNEEITLNWKKGDRLQAVIYDLDFEGNEKILGWDNREKHGFLFDRHNLASPKYSTT